MAGEFEARIRERLSQLTDYVAIEEVAWTLLERAYPSLAPFPGGSDRGRDATVDLSSGKTALVSVSAERDWRSKVRNDVQRARGSATAFEAVVMCTTRPVTSAAIGLLEDDLKVEVIPHTEAWWVLQLAKEDLQTRDLRKRLLGIGPRGLTALLTPDEYATLLGRRAGFIDGPLFGRDPDLKKSLDAMHPGLITLVAGAPGVGKSRFLVEIGRTIRDH